VLKGIDIAGDKGRRWRS